MSRTDAAAISLVKFDELRPLLTNQPLGDEWLPLRIASARLSVPVSVEGVAPLVVTFKAGAEFVVIALNDKNGADADGIVAARQTQPSHSFLPLLQTSASDAWLKYVCTADVALDARAPVGQVAFRGGGSTSATLAHYRHHTPDTGIATAVQRDLGTQRMAIVRDHVLSLAPKDALAFETRGELSALIDVEWSDIFTTEIGSLAQLLRTRGPAAIATTLGATCSAKVTIVDTFIVAFANAGSPEGGVGPLRVAIKKGTVQTGDVAGGVSISARLADPDAVEQVVDDVIAGLLGTGNARLNQLLQNIAANAMTAADQGLAQGILDRLSLADAPAIANAVAVLKARATAAVKQIAETKIGAAFAYEYQRVRSDATVFEGTIAPGQFSPNLHAALIRGDVASAFSAPTDVLAVTRYLNDRKTTMSKAWGFTLGVGKWQVFGRDRRRLERVVRYDVLKQAEWRSYIGSGGYERTRLKWMVDFKTGMRAWASEPLVRDYDFGLHLVWLRDRQNFDADDLETALDFAALWNICPESSRPWLRDRLSALVGRHAEWSFHVRVDDNAFRPIVRAIGSLMPRDLAEAAAAAMDPGAESRPPSARRAAFAPLWRAVLQSADHFNVDTVIGQADRALADAALAWRERQVAGMHGVAPDTVAGIVGSNPDTFDDCQRMIAGSRVLAESIAASRRDDGVVEDVYGNLAPFWSQSHQVRMFGALLLDVADAVAQRGSIERSLNIASGAVTTVISSNDFIT